VRLRHDGEFVALVRNRCAILNDINAECVVIAEEEAKRLLAKFE
jgi:hypothetical protein